MSELLKYRIDEFPCRLDVLNTGLKTIQLVPAGTVETKKGTLVMDAAAAKMVIEAFEQHDTPLPIDFEHQTLGGEFASPDGLAPAAGWIESVFFDATTGLMGMVKWNEKAKALIQQDEYRYLSPVVMVRKEDHRVTGLHSAGLTNSPAIPAMEKVAAKQEVPQEEVTDSVLIPMGLNEKGLMMLLGNIETLAKQQNIIHQPETLEIESALQLLLTLLKHKRIKPSKMFTTEDTPEPQKALQGELEVLREKLADRDAEDLLRPFVERGGLLDRDDTERWDFYYNMARTRPEDCLRILKDLDLANPLPPQGRILPPSPEDRRRSDTVRKAKTSFLEDPRNAKMTSLEAFVNQALRAKGLDTLSDAERREYAIEVVVA